jgi:hypothetical protein
MSLLNNHINACARTSSRGAQKGKDPSLSKEKVPGTILTGGRPLRAAEAGSVYHVLKRANARMVIFGTD